MIATTASQARQDPVGQDELTRRIAAEISWRDSRLFAEFLPEGYRRMSLSCVAPRHFENALTAKLCLGSIITLLDDFADDPRLYDPQGLDRLYLVFNGGEVQQSCGKEELLTWLRELMFDALGQMPNFRKLREILQFDLLQILQANRFHQSLTGLPGLGNETEMRFYGPYNMGMVAAHMIDLMASDRLRLRELGYCREIFLLGQRHGRISNMLSTYEREAQQGDQTSELVRAVDASATAEALRREQSLLLRRISRFHVKQFDRSLYVEGLRSFHRFHVAAAGYI